MTCERPAKLEQAAIEEIQDLETRLGVTLVAYEKVLPYKKLTDDGIAKLKEIEKETRAILVAYEA
ncbi:MAG: hypothetical protein GXY82_01590 [Methanospirillum sp.]|nr:hypothetical protein [Methanospirillum sp.]